VVALGFVRIKVGESYFAMLGFGSSSIIYAEAFDEGGVGRIGEEDFSYALIECVDRIPCFLG
jgi:hypothetical protein